jgi:hypothetical protein
MTSAIWGGCGMTGKCHHQGRHNKGMLHGSLPCECHASDTRIGGKAKHGAPRKPGRRDDHRMHPRLGGLQTSLHDARHNLQLGPSSPKPRHHWLWTGKHHLHLEPAGQRESRRGTSSRSRARPWELAGLARYPNPPHGLVHSPPPPRGKRPQLIPAHHQKVAGHYAWSPVLKKYAWIGTHDNLSVDPSQLPPKLRHAVTSAIKSSLGHTHAHTAWGVSGHRVYVIPGHWHWNKAQKVWTYVERHTDQAGRAQTSVYPQNKAPSAAFGPRPPHATPLHFWPDHTGTLRDAHNRVPADDHALDGAAARALRETKRPARSANTRPASAAQKLRTYQQARALLHRAGRARPARSISDNLAALTGAPVN